MKLTIVFILGLIYMPTVIRPYSIHPPTNVLDKNYRQNFCSLLPSFQNNSITVSQLLRGRTLNVGYNLDGANAYMTESTNGVPFDGFMTNLFVEMARRGNFRINYVRTPNLTLYASNQIFAKTIAPYVDIISGQPFGDTSSRRLIGLGAVTGVADYTVIVIGKVIVTPQSFNLWAFLGPFQNTLWAFIAGLIFFHGLIQFIVEYFAEGKDNDVVIPLTIPNSAFQALGDFAQADTYVSPSSEAGKLLRVGWAFFLIIVVSSYTANLTSFLITRPTNTLSVTSIEDANLRSLTLCVRKQSSFLLDLLDTNYPAIFTYPISTLEPDELMKTLASENSPCSGVILFKDEWQLINQARANPDCLLLPVGNPVRYTNGKKRNNMHPITHPSSHPTLLPSFFSPPPYPTLLGTRVVLCLSWPTIPINVHQW